MCNDFCTIYRKSVRTPIPTTCWQVKRSICLNNMEWPPDLCTDARAKRAPTLFRGLCKSIWQRLSSYLKISLETRTVQTVISRYIEHEELRSKGRYTRQYPYVIELFKIWIIMAHVHAVDTRPSLSSPSWRLGDEANTSRASAATDLYPASIPSTCIVLESWSSSNILTFFTYTLLTCRQLCGWAESTWPAVDRHGQ